MKIICVISDVDGDRYCVRERNKLKVAADLLALTTQSLIKLVDHLKKKYSKRHNVKRVIEGFVPQQIQETLPTSEYVAYTENKGDKIAFCLDTKKKGGRLIDINTLTYVAVHELSHIATQSIGHTDEFWKNFKFLLIEAVKIGIYEPVDYSKQPKPYCGIEISKNIYYI